MWVLVVHNEDTGEVQVRGPWASELEGNGAARAWVRDNNNTESCHLAVVGVTPMVYYDPEVHK